MTTRVLITGIAGFIGSHVVDALSRKKYDIFGIDDLSTGSLDNLIQSEYKIEDIVTESVVNPIAVLATFEKFNPDVVVHLAAQPSLLTSIRNPEFDAMVNILGTINVLRACEGHGVEKFIFASTSAITQDDVVQEDKQGDIADTPYGMSKRTAENYIDLLRHRQDRKSLILRFANVYGPRQVPLGENQLFPRVIRHCLFGDEFEIYGDGEQVRDFVYVEDIAELIKRSIEYRGSYAHSVINGATGRPHTVNEVVKFVVDEIGFKEEIKHGEDRDDRRVVKMDAIAGAQVGWNANTYLQEGIKKTVAWWKEQDG